MKRYGIVRGVLLSVVFPLFLSGCPSFDEEKPVGEVRILLNGIERTGITVQAGQVLQLRAEHDSNAKDVTVTWEITHNVKDGNQDRDDPVAVISSGIGVECSIKGLKVNGNVESTLTVKAWKGTDKPKLKEIAINVTAANLTGIEIAGPNVIATGETQVFTAKPVPEWAAGDFTWTAAPAGIVTPGGTGNVITITGNNAGTVTLRAEAGSVAGEFRLEVREPATPGDLKIFNGTEDVTGSAISIGPYEEISLRAQAVPQSPNDFIFIKWESLAPLNVSVDSSGLVTGLKAGETGAIKVSAGNLSKTVTVNVLNPVTGIRIKYAGNNDGEMLPVSNVIWLAPGEEVTLTAELKGGSDNVTINWECNNTEVSVLPTSGDTNTLKGGVPGFFDDPPAEIRITAQNPDNRGRPVSTVVPVKTQEDPVWAWDRARDGGILPAGTVNMQTGNNRNLKLKGRGTNPNADNMRVRVFGNNITYTASGLKLNSSNANGGNPDPIGAPGNSTRISIGNDDESTYVTGTGNVHRSGDFDFLGEFCEKGPGGSYILKPEAENKTIRVSVDYEIIWSAGAGRDMWIMLNNNNANAAQSVLNTASQILIEPLTAARGTKATAVTYIDVNDFIKRSNTGSITWLDTLETSFICIIALSNGGSIYVSGIRIEYE